MTTKSKFTLTFMLFFLMLLQTARSDELSDYNSCIKSNAPAISRIEICKSILQRDFLDNQDRSFAHHTIAEGYRIQGIPKQAIEHFTQSIDLNPNWSAGYIGRGMSLLSAGQPEPAAQDFSEAISISGPRAALYSMRAASYLAMGRIDDGLADFDYAITLEPSSSQHHANRSGARFLAGDYAGADEDARRAIELDAENGDAHKSLATLLSLSPEAFRDPESAIIHAEEAVRIRRSSSNVGILAVALSAAGRINEGVGRFSSVFEMNPNVGAQYQAYLRFKGYYDGPINGMFSNDTEKAIRQCFAENCRFMIN